MQIEVRHNEAAAQFEAVVDGLPCHADYRRDGDTMRAFHTEVPRALEGRGIASELVRALFAHAEARGLSVDPVCSYVRAWARRHPEVESLLVRS